MDEDCSPTIANNRIHDCTAEFGGGVYCMRGDPLIIKNFIYGNSYKYGGGGINSYNASPVIVSNVIHHNTGWGDTSTGGGVRCQGSEGGYPVLTNNTIVDNTAEQFGGAVLVKDHHVTLNNNIIAFNSSGVYNYGGSSFTWSHNCFHLNYYNGTDPVGTNGNIREDPGFVARGSDDYHLMAVSPCIDSGDDAAVQSGWVDMDGQARIAQAHVDIGADETYYCATPVFSPNHGTYYQPQSVTVTCATPGAIIHYTTNGTDPTEASAIYTEPIAVNQTLTLKARAYKQDWDPSYIYPATYTLRPALPTFTPPGGTYATPQSVEISCATPDVTIHYTTNDVDPTEADPIVTGPISIEEDMWLKARAYRTGWNPSLVQRAGYTFRAATPEFDPPGGTYNEPQDVSITCATPDATIHYTTNGVNPTESDPIVTGPVTVTGQTVLKATAFRINWTASYVQSAVYTIQIAPPEFNPDGGSYECPQSVAITCATPGVTIRYTTDNSDPTETSPIVSHNIAIDTTTILKAKAWRQGWIESEIKSALYTLSLPTPTFNPTAGAYHAGQNVEIICPVAGAEIHYTTNGSDPTEADPLYTSPLLLSSDTVLKAKAWLDGWNPSGVAEAEYTFQAAAPVFSPGPATRYSPLDVTITCATPGAQIRYTTNGADPTEGSPLYTGPIHIDGTMTIKARAWNSGWTPSDITSGLYTLKVYAPIFSPAGGTFTSPISVSMSCDTPGATIRYTTDGATPDETSSMYTGPVYINHSVILRANAWKSGWTPSTVRSATYAFPVFVKPTGNDSNTGASWQFAKRTVAGGLDVAISGGEVWVAAGTYIENITMKSGVALYGGFAGNESLRSRRDWNANPTVLDGKQLGSVLTVPAGASVSTRIDGFTIRNGIAPAGGGIYCDSNSRVRITNNIISANAAKAASANVYGGGIYCYDSSAWIFNNVIVGNSAYAMVSGGNNWGAGIYCTGGATVIFNNTIIGNNAIDQSGSNDYGGGISCQNSSPMVHGNIIAFNSSGVGNPGSGAPALYCNNLYGNTAYNWAGFTPDATNISVDPIFVDFAGGNYHLSALSPCVDSGSDTLAPENDMDGLPRPMDGNSDGVFRADMGAYEYPFDLASARNTYSNGQAIAFGNVGVTAGFSAQGFIYVEKADRSSGIRVETDESIMVGSRVSVAGIIRTKALTGERYIEASPPSPEASGLLLVLPVGMSNRALGGAANGLQGGVTGGTGLNNIGLLVTVWGKVLTNDFDHFIVDDGSGNTAKCMVPGDVTMPSVNAYVSVTGISSSEASGGDIRSVILLRDKRDIVTIY